MTSLEPRHGPNEILFNNFDDRGHVTARQTRFWDKIEWVIKLEMDINKVKKVENIERDVYLHEGDIKLENYQYSIEPNPYTKILLYYYTDATGADGIKKDKVVKGSTVETPKKNQRYGYGKSLVC